MILDNYPFLNYIPIGAFDGATEVGPSFIFLQKQEKEHDLQFVVWLFNTLKVLFSCLGLLRKFSKKGKELFFLPELVIVVNLSITYACWLG